MEEENYHVIHSFEKNNWWYRAKKDLFDLILSRTNRKFNQALDVGCGVGSNFQVLKKYSKNVIGIDFFDKSIFYCKPLGYTSLHKMDATNLKFKDNSFDLILCSDVLEHLNDIKAIKEITRVLRPHGLLIFSVPSHNYLWGPTDIISKHVKRYEKPDFYKLFGKKYKIHKLSYWNFAVFLPDLLFISILKLFKRIKKGKNSLETIPRFMNNLLYFALYFENRWFVRFNNPQGVSIVGIVEKIK